MEKTIFEQLGGTYAQQGDYYLPNIKLPKQPEYEIGVWGQRRRRFLKEHHRVRYYNMLTKCTLYSHLAEVEQQANTLFLRLVDELAEKEGVTEQLKAEDPLAWVQKMNNIRNRATEIVNTGLIFEETPKFKIVNNISSLTCSQAIGRWARLHLEYLETYNPKIYQKLLISCGLYDYLDKIEISAQKKYEDTMDLYKCFGYDTSKLLSEEIVLQDIVYKTENC